MTVSRRRSDEEPDLDDDDESTACSTGVASYARFSSEMQDSRSITDQQRKCRERAASMGLEIDPVLEFVDEAVSGAKHNREGFEAMMTAARSGAIRVVLFENLSRLARDVGVTINTLKELVYRHRVRIVSIDDSIDTETHQQWEFIAVILGVQNEQYLRTLAKFVHRGQEGVVLEGLSVGDYCFGYGSEPVSDEETGRRGKNSKPKKKYVIVKEHAAWVECIFTWFVEERRSLRWITRELNRNNVPKDHRSSTPKWHHQQLSGLLSNRKYIGEWSWGRLKNERDPLTGVVRQVPRSPAEFEKWHRTIPELKIIDESLFERAQELLAENVRVLTETRRSDAKSGIKPGQIYGATAQSSERWPRHLLSGLIFCGECDHKFYVSGRMSQYMSCPQYARGACSCKTTLRRDLAESAILKEIMGRLTVDPNAVAALVQAAHTAWLDSNAARPTEEQSVRQKLADVTRRIEKLMDRCETEDSPELTRRLAARCTERDTLRQRLAKLTASLREAATPPTEEWVVSQLSDVRSVLSQAGPAAHAALRTLVNGRIMAHEVKRLGKCRHFIRLKFHLDLYSVLSSGSTSDQLKVELDGCNVECDVRERPQYETLADDIKADFDAGMPVSEIETKYSISYTVVTYALNHWHDAHGVPRPDGRSLRQRLPANRASDRLMVEIMELWQQDLPVKDIAARLDCGLETVRAAVVTWHESRGLPVPDGRERRKRIRLERENANS